MNRRGATPRKTMEEYVLIVHSKTAALTTMKFVSTQGVMTALGNQRQDDPEFLNAMLDQVHKAGVDFSVHALAIVTGLYTHPDQDCRFLAVRLSFNDYYKIQRREVAAKTAPPVPAS